MTLKKRIQLGDIFLVEMFNKEVKYFQYIGNDLTQLNSDVIRVFKKKYLQEEHINFDELAKSEIDFHAHCVLKFGIKLNCWKKIGNYSKIYNLDSIKFRGTNDYGSKPNEQIDVSNNWYVWNMNTDFIKVGKFEGLNRDADIGVVFPPYSIVHRIKTGQYDIVYPKYM